jgi:hypothetical protein
MAALDDSNIRRENCSMKISGVLVVTIIAAVALLASGAEAFLSLQVLAGRETALPCRIDPGMVLGLNNGNAEAISTSYIAHPSTHFTFLLTADDSAREGETARGGIGRGAGVGDRDAARNDHRMFGNERNGFGTGEYGMEPGYENDFNENRDQDDASSFRIDKDKYYMDRDPYYMDRRVL